MVLLGVLLGASYKVLRYNRAFVMYNNHIVLNNEI